MPFSPQVCCRFRLRLDLTSHSSILATASEGEGSAKAGMSIEEVREAITATADIPPPPQLSTLSRVTDVAIFGEHSTVSHAPSSDVEVHSSSTPVHRIFLPIGTLSSLNSAVTPSEHTFLRQNLILRCQPPLLVAHLVHGIRVLLLRETRAPRLPYARKGERTNLTTTLRSRWMLQRDCCHLSLSLMQPLQAFCKHIHRALSIRVNILHLRTASMILCNEPSYVLLLRP